jgi:hypothetical protein
MNAGRIPASAFRPRCHLRTEFKLVNPIRKEMSSAPGLPVEDGSIYFDNIVEVVLLIDLHNYLKNK